MDDIRDLIQIFEPITQETRDKIINFLKLTRKEGYNVEFQERQRTYINDKNEVCTRLTSPCIFFTDYTSKSYPIYLFANKHLDIIIEEFKNGEYIIFKN